MKLPVEIRYRILEFAIDGLFKHDHIILCKRNTDCACPQIWGVATQSSSIKALYSILGSQTNEEFFRLLFRRKTLHFRCPCEMNICLSQNRFIKNYARSIHVQWAGPKSDKAFRQLADCENVESIKLTLTKGTLLHVNEREARMRRSFPSIPTRLTDALGLNELLELRGFQQVTLVCSHGRGMSIYEPDRACLQKMLSDSMKLPREL
jgi:hypothetical protein